MQNLAANPVAKAILIQSDNRAIKNKGKRGPRQVGDQEKPCNRRVAPEEDSGARHHDP